MCEIKAGDIADVQVEKLSNLGLGIAKLDGYVLFIPNSCPNDKLRVKVVKKNKNYGYGEIEKIIESSSDRVEPFCKMQKVCGSCQLQFIDYNAQLKYKKELVQDAMHSIIDSIPFIGDVVPSPENREYRHKIQYPISETKDSKRLLAGYYKSGTHEIVNIKYCPIQPDYCDKIIEYIRENAKNFNISGYKEDNCTGMLRHVVIRTSSVNKKSLVTLVVNTEKITKNITDFSKSIYENLPDISGVCLNFNTKKTNLIMGEKTQSVIGTSYIEESLCDKTFRIASKTFFQVNPESADNIFRYVKKYISENYKNPDILDAYAGISAFGICLSDIASSVVSVEEVKDSVDLAKQTIELNKAKNVTAICADAGKYFSELVKQNKKFDVTILDPPRKGCTKESLDYALKLTKSAIIYVSCNPSTLARDLKYLIENGAKIESIQPFDMFPHTYHIENVAIIKLNK